MSTDQDRAPRIRRVVTGHDDEGKATVWLDDIATNVRFPNDMLAAVTMWSTDTTPADFLKQEDFGARKLGTAAPINGTRFSVLEIQPDFKAPTMHRTDSLDCSVVLAGHPTLYMEDGTRVELNPQDVVIHRGTLHAWANHGTEVARLFGVLVDGFPKRPGSLSGTQVADLPAEQH